MAGTKVQNDATVFARRTGTSAQIVLLFNFYILLLSLLTHIMSALIS